MMHLWKTVASSEQELVIGMTTAIDDLYLLISRVNRYDTRCQFQIDIVLLIALG
ncbi:hypothetical protein [Methylobacter luteus]|uniref:hypothetical protein n=1 Tax=Methylobacter luteus TaxID=415 RepID=UPI0018C9FE22|nr:hypothetical protein [Methylobacter luteus]